MPGGWNCGLVASCGLEWVCREELELNYGGFGVGILREVMLF